MMLWNLDPLWAHPEARKGQEILDLRKVLAFAGFTNKSARAISYARADKAFNPEPDPLGQEEPVRGHSTLRSDQDIGKGHAVSV